MRLIPPLLQILALTAGFSANRADAMAGAAIFAVLCVAVVAIKASQPSRRASIR